MCVSFTHSGSALKLVVIFDFSLSFCPTPDITNSFISSFKTYSESDHSPHQLCCRHLVQARRLPPVSAPVSPRLSPLCTNLPPPHPCQPPAAPRCPASVLSLPCSKPRRGHSLPRSALSPHYPLTSAPTVLPTLSSQLPASLPLLRHGGRAPTPRPLRWLCPPSGMFSARVALCLANFPAFLPRLLKEAPSDHPLENRTPSPAPPDPP